MSSTLAMFLGFVAVTLAVTWWSARRSSGASAYFAAGRRITGWQNGLAIAGDYMSAASFLGIAGMIAFHGFDGFMYSVGWLVAYLTVLLIVAEPLRNSGKYTMADVLAYRLQPAPGARDGLAQHAHGLHFLHDRADGRRRLAGQAAAARRELRGGRGRGGRADDRVRGLRRHARHHLGADHQGGAADERHAVPQRAGAGALRLQLRGLLRGDCRGELDRRRRRDGNEGLPATGLDVPASLGRDRAAVAGARADLRHGGSAAHPGALLHRARCAHGAHLGGVGDGADRALLHHDHLPRLRRGDHPRRPPTSRSRT